MTMDLKISERLTLHRLLEKELTNLQEVLEWLHDDNKLVKVENLDGTIKFYNKEISNTKALIEKLDIKSND